MSSIYFLTILLPNKCNQKPKKKKRQQFHIVFSLSEICFTNSRFVMASTFIERDVLRYHFCFSCLTLKFPFEQYRSYFGTFKQWILLQYFPTLVFRCFGAPTNELNCSCLAVIHGYSYSHFNKLNNNRICDLLIRSGN